MCVAYSHMKLLINLHYYMFVLYSYGIAIHFRVYPIIYSIAFLVLLDGDYDPKYSRQQVMI